MARAECRRSLPAQGCPAARGARTESDNALFARLPVDRWRQGLPLPLGRVRERGWSDRAFRAIAVMAVLTSLAGCTSPEPWLQLDAGRFAGATLTGLPASGGSRPTAPLQPTRWTTAAVAVPSRWALDTGGSLRSATGTRLPVSGVGGRANASIRAADFGRGLRDRGLVTQRQAADSAAVPGRLSWDLPNRLSSLPRTSLSLGYDYTDTHNGERDEFDKYVFEIWFSGRW